MCTRSWTRFWPLGFVIIALVSFGLSAGDGDTGRRVLVLLLTAVWGLRLGAHLYLRNAGQGEDKRYAALLRRNQGNLAAFVLRYIYWAQGRVMWFVSLPLQVAMYEHAGQAHRQEAAREAHGALQGRRVRRLRPPHQRLHPLASAVTW